MKEIVCSCREVRIVQIGPVGFLQFALYT
jgi:hypothetical protein